MPARIGGAGRDLAEADGLEARCTSGSGSAPSPQASIARSSISFVPPPAGISPTRLRPARCRSRPRPARDRRAGRSRIRRRAQARPAPRRPARPRSRSAMVARWNARTIRSTSSQLPSCASSSSSIRFAPAEKFGASLPTTSARKFAAASFTPRVEHLRCVSPPIAFIFEWNSTPSTPSPRSTRLAPALLRTTVCASRAAVRTRRRRGRDRGRAGHAAIAGASARARPASAARRRSASRTASTPIASHVSNGPSSQPNPQRIARSTSSDRVGDLGGDPRRVEERRRQRVAQELADLVAGRGTACGCARRRPRSIAPRRSRGRRGRLPRRGMSSSRDRASGSRPLAVLLVEALARLGADPAALDQRADERRQRERAPASARRSRSAGCATTCARTSMPAMSIVRKVALFGRPIAGPGDRVDLLDRVSPVAPAPRRSASAPNRPRRLAMKFGRVLRDDDALAEPPVGELGDAADDRRIGVGGRDDLEQVQVARRIEEVRAEPVLPERVGPAFGDARERNAGGVRADDACRRAIALDAREQRLLDVEPLDDRLDDPVGGARAGEIGRRSCRCVISARRVRVVKNGSGLSAARASSPSRAASAVTSSSSDGHAGIGQVRGDLRAHRAGAEHGRGADARFMPGSVADAARRTGRRSRRRRRRASTCGGSGSSWWPSRRARRTAAWRRASG